MTLKERFEADVAKAEAELEAAKARLVTAEQSLGSWFHEEEDKAKEFFRGIVDKFGF